MIEWKYSEDLVPYNDAIEFMEQRNQEIFEEKANQTVWLLQHPPVYTMGTSADISDVIDAKGIELIKTGRGGKITYHGPGQRIIYLMLDLRKQGRDVRAFVCNVEKWVIAALKKLGIEGNIRDGRVGVWVDRKLEDGSIREEKIAAIGLRIRRWVSFHGISINVNPNLEHFGGIVPCGISKEEHGITSLYLQNPSLTMEDLDKALKETFSQFFSND